MNVEYKRENHKSYLVMKNFDSEDIIKHEEAKDFYGVKMLCENSVIGLLPVSIHVFNGEKELYYDISTKQSLYVLYEKREMRKDDLEKLFIGMKTALKNTEDYLLEMEYLHMNPEYIYVHSADESVNLLYCPFKRKDFEKEVYDFAEYILGRVCNEDEQAVVYAYGFYRYIKEEKGDLSQALERLMEDREMERETGGLQESGQTLSDEDSSWSDLDFYPDDEETILEQEKEKKENNRSNRQFLQKVFFIVLGLGGLGIMAFSVWKYALTWDNLFSETESIAGAGIVVVSIAGMLLFKLMDIVKQRELCRSEIIQEKEKEAEGEKTSSEMYPADLTYEDVLEDLPQLMVAEEGNYETVLLQENCYQEQRILTGWIKGRRKQIDLSTFPFIIGKNKEQSDYVLEDSSVSRIHARFTLRDDVVYLTDLNSTNGTCKNGIRLEPNELVMLEADDEITFGRLTFTYH